MAIDYRSLLKKYIEHVIDCNDDSTDFIGFWCEASQMSKEEKGALQELSNEVSEEIAEGSVGNG